jgi:hypothetical protein
MKHNPRKAFLPVVILFVVVNALLIVFRSSLQRKGIDQEVVIIGNLLLFGITLLTYLLGVRGLHNPNPHAFVRSVYSSMLIKLFGCATLAFVYISMSGDALNKPALFTCMGLYLVYAFMEVSILTGLLKSKRDA